MTFAQTNAPPRTSRQSIELEAGDLLYRQWEPGSSIYHIDSGHLALVKSLSKSRRQVLCLLSKGDYFGFPLAGRRDSDAETICAATVTEISAWGNEDGLDHSIYETLQVRLTLVYERLTLLGRQTAEERVASFIVEMGGDGGLDVPLKTSLVADYLGLRIETVSRILHKFRRKGLILQAVFKGNMAILDEAGLIVVSQGK